jgi:nucleotidyltransferase substrate binding protein (TIGR01987 family)
MNKLDSLKIDYKKAMDKLEEVLEKEKNEIYRDSAIKRFEFTFDLSWKLVKTYLEEEYGVLCNSPKSCFREAYTQELIKYSDLWIKIVDWRNLSTHTYSEEFANDLYKELPKFLKLFKELNKKIQ